MKFGGSFGESPCNLAGFAQRSGGIDGGQAYTAFFGFEDFRLRAAFEKQARLGGAGAAPLFEALGGGIETAAIGRGGIVEG